jgi:hypothetical protein
VYSPFGTTPERTHLIAWACATGRSRGEQSRLPDAGGPFDEHQAAAAGGRGVDEREQSLEFRLPVDESLERQCSAFGAIAARRL